MKILSFAWGPILESIYYACQIWSLLGDYFWQRGLALAAKTGPGDNFVAKISLGGPILGTDFGVTGPQRCFHYSPNCQGTSQIPLFPMEWQNIQVYLPSI